MATWEEIFTSSNPAGGRMINVISGVAGSEASPYTADNPAGGRAINVNLIGGGNVATGVLQLNGGVPLDTTLRSVTDQANTVSPLQLSTTQVGISGSVAGALIGIFENTSATGFGFVFKGGVTNSTYNTNWTNYSGTDIMRLYPIGLSVGGGFVPSARLHVRGDGTNPIARFEPTSGSNAIFIDSTCTSLSINGTLYSNESVYRSITTDMYSVYNDGTAGTGISFYGSGHATTFLRNKILLMGSFWALGAINDAGAPAIKRNGAAIDFRLADDSGYADITTNNINLVGYIYKNATSNARLTSFNNGFVIEIGASTILNASSILDLNSTTKGFLPPRMTTVQKNAIGTPAEGLVVMDTTLHKLCVYSGSAWEVITSV